MRKIHILFSLSVFLILPGLTAQTDWWADKNDNQGYQMIVADNHYGLKDGSGNIVAQPVYEHIANYNQYELAEVRLNGKYGFIDRNGQVVIPIMYESVGSFSDGRCPVQVGRKWGYINTSNQMVIPAKFVEADDFYHGTASVKRCSLSDNTIVINVNGKVTRKIKNKSYKPSECESDLLCVLCLFTPLGVLTR